MIILDLLFALAVAWILFRAVTQYSFFHRVDPAATAPTATLTVIIPARNEERNIGLCLDGLIAQDYPPDQLHIVMVDDDSTDKTRALAAAHGGDRLTLLSAPPLPPGWTGKCNACWHAAQSAAGDYLCFIDADVRALAPMLKSALACAESEKIDMLSLEPFQRMEGFWERMILPAGFLLLAATQDLKAVNDPSSAACTANGQFILIRRSVYQAIGGHAAVSNTVAEDSAMATAVKRAGFKVALRDGGSLLQVRMYNSLASLWEGLTKNIPEMLHGIWPAILSALLACLLAAASIGLPLAAAISVSRHASAIGIVRLVLASAAAAALLFTHAGIARHFRFPVWFAPLYPFSYFLGAILVSASVIKRVRRRVSWKGRTYTPAPIPARVK